MNDAVALLAISQLVCLGAIFYLYTQVQQIRRFGPKRREPSTRVHRMPGVTEVSGHAAARAARAAYTQPVSRSTAQPTAVRADIASLVAQGNGVIDVSVLARRMHKSEDEIRLLLRRQGIAG